MLDAVIASAHRLSAADKLRLIEVLIEDLKGALPEQPAQAAATPSPEDIQQMRDEVCHDF